MLVLEMSILREENTLKFNYSGDELSGVGGLKISFDFRNFDF